VPWFVSNALPKSDVPDPAQHSICNKTATTSIAWRRNQEV